LSRTPFHKNVNLLHDFRVNTRNADIFLILIIFRGFGADSVFYCFPLFPHER